LPRIDFWLVSGLPESAIFHLEQLMISVPEEYTITHFAGGAMPNDFRSIFSSSCSVPIWIFILGTKKQQKQNNQSISNNLSQTNIHLSKINFHGEFALDIAYINLFIYCAHIYISITRFRRKEKLPVCGAGVE